MTKREYTIENLDCAGCAAKIETAANKMDGIEHAVLDFVGKKMTVKYSGENVDELEQKFFSTADGIESGVVFKPINDEKTQKQGGKLFSTTAAIVCMVAAVIMSFVSVPALTVNILFISAVLFGGYDCIYSGIKSLLTLRMNEKLLMTIAIVAAAILGEYFEAAMVAVLFRIGGILEEHALERSRKNIESLASIQPDIAVLKTEDGEKEVDCEDVKIDDIIIIAPHARIPLDGVVTEGNSMLDTSALTGESVPVSADKGTKVLSGMLNGNGTLEVQVTDLMENSAAARIIKSVNESVAKKGESEKFITRFASVYTPIVVVLAIILAFLPPILGLGSFSSYIHRALTFLVASCPCALVIGVPLGFFSAIGGMTKLGMLVKGSKYIEKLGTLKAMAFDKTGTLTTGELHVTDIFNQTEMSDGDFLKIMASCEYYSTHPIAQSIKNSVEGEIEKFSDYSEESGNGVKCVSGEKEYICGSNEYMSKNSVDTSDIPSCNVYLACDGKILGGITLADTPRPQLKENLNAIKSAGVEYFAILSGDSASSVMNIAKKSGIQDAYPSMSPDDKVAIVEQIKAKHGSTAFLGDGINDAPVLASADVGIAMEFGSDSAVETSDAVLVSGNLASLPRIISFARKALKTIYGLVAFALIVKAVVLILAVFELAPMWLAVFADVGVTLISIAMASSLMFPGKE